VHSGKSLQDGTIEHILRGGLKDGFCKLSDYGPAVSEDTKKAAEAAKAGLIDGSLVIYTGEVKDNKGGVVVKAGESLPQKEPKLEGMNYLVEGVLGSVGG